MLLLQEPDNDWGGTPIDGLSFDKTNASQINGGLGGLVNKNYDIATSIWNLSPGRLKWFDYHQPFTSRGLKIYFNFQLDAANFMMYLDPLQPIVWIAVLTLLALATSGIVILTQIPLKDGMGLRLFQLLCWLFYLFVHSVYSGALTTNFIVMPEFPFKTLQEGLALYPTWNMCIMKDVTPVLQVSKTLSIKK